MTSNVAFLAVFALCVGILVFAVIYAREHPQPPARRKFGAGEFVRAQLVGGVMWQVYGIPWRVTSPMACLQVLDAGVRIGPNGMGMGAMVPTWDFEWNEILGVETTAGGVVIRVSGTSLKFLALPTTDRSHAFALLQAGGTRAV